MPSTVVLITSITSLIGFIINVLVMSVVLWRGRRRYHLLFAVLLFIVACWDLGIFLVMIRNSNPSDVLLYQNIVTIPVAFFPGFLYHFTTTYLNRPHRMVAVSIYGYCVLTLIALVTMGGGGGIRSYEWGNIASYELASNLGQILVGWLLVYYLSLGLSCWLLLQARKREPSPVARRHIGYILASFVVFSVAQVKLLVTLGVDLPFTLPLGMLLVDLFGALIGVAIVKDRLFDITVILKKGTAYSALGAVIIFLFAFSEHLIATYLAGVVGALSEYLHLASIAVVVVAFMPVKRRVDHLVEGYFTTKRVVVEF
jgi:hypothetical protein